MFCSVLQYTVARATEPQWCVAVCCSMLQCAVTRATAVQKCSAIVCCSVLQYVVVCCGKGDYSGVTSASEQTSARGAHTYNIIHAHTAPPKCACVPTREHACVVS